MNMQLDFYQEVKVRDNHPELKYCGKKGVVLGISEENGIVYAYGIFIYDIERVFSFNREDLIPTGKIFSREDFY